MCHYKPFSGRKAEQIRRRIGRKHKSDTGELNLIESDCFFGRVNIKPRSARFALTFYLGLMPKCTRYPKAFLTKLKQDQKVGVNGEGRGLKFTLSKKSARLSVPFEKKNAGLSVPPQKKLQAYLFPLEKDAGQPGPHLYNQIKSSLPQP